MSLASFLQAWGVTRETAQTGKKYGVVSRAGGVITVRAPSGADALQIAGADGRTAEGRNYTVANHKGNGVYEVKDESW